MERSDYTIQTLDLIPQPAFCVHDGLITGANSAAMQRQFCVGTAITELLVTGKEEYAQYCGGTLSLTLCAANTIYNASVVRLEDCDIFSLEPEADQTELRAMALAAQTLREPLASIMTVTDHILDADTQATPAMRQRLSQINRGLFRLQRLIGNMTQASQCGSGKILPRLETRNVRAVFDEIFEKAAVLAEQAGQEVLFTGLQQDIFCLVDSGLLEQAIYNLLSNAIKFSTNGNCITAKLSRNRNKLYFTIQDGGQGVEPALRSSVFTRYQRQPGIEDGRYGIGLGMTIVRAAANAHGGTLLMEQPEGEGARFTMTIAIRQNIDGIVRSPIIPIDASGGYSRELIELSDVLPASLYEK